ncbi:MAG: hypothetical protein MJ162_07115, partial [Treponema sp.]|nr:hypothetical protein [Treponema sp.]
SLTAGADATFDDTVGSTAALASIEVTGKAEINTTAVTTTGNQTWSGEVTVTKDVSFTSDAESDISFAKDISGENKTVTFASGNINLAEEVTVEPAAVNNGTMNLSDDGEITFRDDYSGSGTLNGGKGTNTFEADADFSEITFTHQNGTLVFTGEDAVISGNTSTGTAFSTVELKNSCTVKGNNSYVNLKAEDIDSTIKFEGGKTQTVSETLTLTGTDEDNKLKVQSTEDGTQWNIDFTGVINETTVVINQIELTDSNNITKDSDSNPVFLLAMSSKDCGNNKHWHFPGQPYIWQGSTTGAENDWFTDTNWLPASVPGFGAVVRIPNDKTDYPVLDVTNAPDGAKYVDIKNPTSITDKLFGTITLESNAQIDLTTVDVTADEFFNYGRVRLNGSQTIAVATDAVNGISTAAGISNEDGSVVEYYGECSTVQMGISYYNIEFTDGANTGDSEIDGNLEIGGTTLIANGAANKLKLSGDNSFTGKVSLGRETPAVDAGYITVNSITDFIVTDGAKVQNLELTAAEKNVEFEGTLTVVENLGITSAKVKLAADADIGEDITITADLFKAEKDLTAGGNSLVSGNAILGGSYEITGDADFQKTVYVYGTSGTANITAGTDKEFTISEDLIFGADASKNIHLNTSDSQLTAQNIVLYGGNVSVQNKVTAEKDLILTGAAYNVDDVIADEFKYAQTRLSDYSYKTPIDSALTCPDEETVLTVASGALTVAPDTVIKAGINFYANGISITGSGEWILALTDLTNAANGFAEAHNTEVSGSKVICYTDDSDDGSLARVAAYNCTDNGTNTNWEFDDFVITAAYTVRDNVVRIDFNRPVRNLHGELTGSSGVVNLGEFTYSAGIYGPVYSDPDCTDENLIPSDANLTTYDAITDSYYFYIKAADGDSWNTDATGSDEGAAESTDHTGVHKSIIPYVNIPRAVEGHSYLVTDIWGKRLNHYNGDDKFAAVEDHTGPVLYKVRTGQEMHTTLIETSAAEDQKAYDSHNFIEFTYSEKVLFTGTSDDTLLNGNPAVDDIQNIAVTNDFGALKGDITKAGPLNFAGIGIINDENGLLYTGNQGAVDNLVNAFYRQSDYSLKLSVAGLTAGTVTDDKGLEYRNWIGYIEKAALPEGNINYVDTLEDYVELYTRSVNKAVRDISPAENYQECYAYEAANYIPSVDSTPNGIYGKWDISEPIFAPLRMGSARDWSSYKGELSSEVVGNTNGTGSTLDRVEFHLFDNTPAYGAADLPADEAEWVSEIGWVTPGLEGTKANLYKKALNFTQSADVIGGSRPFENDPANRTSGGIRYSSVRLAAKAFKYNREKDEAPNTDFADAIAFAGATTPIFTGSQLPRQSSATKDGLYFGIPLEDQTMAVDTTFIISYDDTKAYITDLAGNRLRSYTLTTVDRTPPSFDLTLSPINQKEVLVTFVKQLNTEPVYLSSTDSALNTYKIDEDFVHLMPLCFELGTIDADGNYAISTDLQIDTTQPAQIIRNNNENDFTSFKLILNRDVTLNDIRNLYIRVILPKKYEEANGSTAVDPFTHQSGARITFLQDHMGNFTELNAAHALSDFVVGCISPAYAYDIDMISDDETPVAQNLYSDEEGSWAVHDWNRDQQNFGTLPFGRNLMIFANCDDGTEESLDFPARVRIYMSSKPTEGSVSVQLNKDMKADYRIWLPNVTNDVFASLATANNKNVKSSDGELLDITDPKFGMNFELSKNFMKRNFKAGDQISFLFSLLDENDNPYTVIHSPELDIDNDGKYRTTSTKYPLYALRLSDPEDISSIDLWSFRLKENISQRGGVTILNNVINVTNGEKTVVKLDAPEDGKVSIIVMTLDGDVVTYLNRGEVYQGEHFYTWDGKNQNGKPCARGMYFIRVIGSGIDETRKVMIVK